MTETRKCFNENCDRWDTFPFDCICHKTCSGFISEGEQSASAPVESPSTGSAGFLPDDYARCDGFGSDEEGWREGCDVCLRRLAKRPDRVQIMAPPPIIAFECEWLIEQNVKPDLPCAKR